jgi:hypothetical protein
MNHTGRKSVGLRLQASKKRLVMGATRMAVPSCLRKRKREILVDYVAPPNGGH